MRIKTADRQRQFVKLVESPRRAAGVKYALVLGYTLAVFAGGIYFHATWNLSELYAGVLRIPRAFAQARAAMQVSPERIAIHVKFKHYQQLAHKREVVLAQNMLLSNDEDFVPAMIEHQGKTIAAKIRLKGDIVRDHISDEHKWSFRVKTSGEGTLFGMKQFSLHHPRAEEVCL